MEPRPGFADEGSRGLVPDGAPTLVCVEAAERLSVIVTGTGMPPQAANGDGRIRDLTPLREQASRDGIAIEIEPAADGTRLAWSLPLRP